MAIKQFNGPACEMLRGELNKALAAVAKKHGLQITVGRMGYQATNVKVALEIALLNEGGVAETREAQAFRMFAETSLRMKESDLGRTLTIRGKDYVLIGFKPRTKYPMQCKKVDDGGIWGFPTATVKHALGYEVTKEELTANL